MIKTCVVCDSPFNALYSAKCCSPPCSRTWHRKVEREYYAAHIEKAREKLRKCRTAHLERAHERDRKYNAARPKKRKIKACVVCGEMFNARKTDKCCRPECSRQLDIERERMWAMAHPESLRENVRRYCASERGKAVRVAAKYNRRMGLSGIAMTADTVLELKAEYGGICPYCNGRIAKGHVDHIVPVSGGGTNDRDNLAWVCETCNTQKGNKSLLAFMLYRQVLGARS